MKLIFSLLLPVAVAAAAQAGIEIIPTQGRNIYRLAVAKTGERPNACRIIGSTYDNRVCAFSIEGKHLWDRALGGFAFDLCCADLDGDGADEILTAGADGVIGCFSADGKEKWTHPLPAPVQQVTVARLDGKSPVVLAGGISRQILMLSPAGQVLRTARTEGALSDVAIRMLRAGDFDGDGKDEAALQGLRGQALEIRFLKGEDLKSLPAMGSRNGLKTPNGVVADLNGDKTAELLIGNEVISLKGPEPRKPSRLAELPGEPKARSYDYHYRMRSLAAGNLAGDPGMEIVTLDGPDLQLCAADGKVLGSAQAPISFSDAVYLPGSPYGSLLLGSGLGGDDNLYRLRFDRDWTTQLSSLPRSGQRKTSEENLGLIAQSAVKWQGQPMIGAEAPFDVVVSHYIWAARTTLKSVDGWIAEVQFFRQNFPYQRLRFSTCVWPGEQSPLARPDGKTWPHDKRLSHDLKREELIAIARKFEQARCPFWIQVGHGCSPHLSVESAAAMLKAAPGMCLGFISSEDEQAGEMVYYFEHHVRPLLELCLAHGKKFIPRNKNVWWCHWPADPELRKLIFNGRYRSVLLPCVEDSNSRTADAQLAARVGLWLDGQVDDWASRCCADWFSFNRAWEWEAVRTGHPHLRYFTSQALLGARVFMLLAGDRERASGAWTRVGSEGIAPFLHLLGRGVITPPKREQMKSISPLALNLANPTERFGRHGANGHGYQLWNVDGTENTAWAFDRLDCYWGMAPLPLTDVSTYLWGRTRRSAEHLPVTTPHGLVCLVPGPAPKPNGPWTTIWTTDGDKLSRNGRDFSLADARAALTADLAATAMKLPFAVKGQVFHQVIEQSQHHYIIALIDPGWLDPGDREASLAAQMPNRWLVTDRLSGAKLGDLRQPLALRVPAGSLRLIELSPAITSTE